MSFYLPMFAIAAVAVVVAPLALFVGPLVMRKFASHREHKRRSNRRY